MFGSVGGTVASEGGWRTSIQKLDEDRVFVSLSRIEHERSSLFTGTYFARVNASRAENLESGFGFVFDFHEGGQDAIIAYEEMLKGDVTPAQRAIDSAHIQGVRKIESFDTVEMERSRGGFIGLPIVANHRWRNARITGETTRITHYNQMTTDIHYGIYVNEQRGRFFNKHRELLKSFYAGKAVQRDHEGQIVDTDNKAHFTWRFENDWGKTWKLHEAVEDIQKNIGIGDSFDAVVSARRSEDLGFIRLEANLILDERFTERLLAVSRNGSVINRVRTTAQNLVNSYFQNGDVYDLCDNRNNHNDRNDAFQCRSRLRGETNRALNRIEGLIEDLRAAQGSEDTFTQLYANIGRELMRNKFVMKSFLTLDVECLQSFEVVVEGRRINRSFTKVPANFMCR